MNEQAGQLPQWQQEYNQLSDGAFSGAMTHIELGAFHLFEEQTSQALQQYCRVPDGAIWLGFSARPQRVSINQQQADANTIMVRPGGVDFELATDCHSTLFGVVIAPATLPGQAETAPEDFAQTLVSPQAEALRRYMTLLVGQCENRWQSKTHEQLLVSTLSRLLHAPGDAMPGPHQRHRALTALNDYLAQVDDEASITVAELAAIAGISPRALHRIWCNHYGVSVARFLQARRLNQVRRALQSNDTRRCIADVAFDHGFYHLSQFSKQYHRLFGELPSRTTSDHAYTGI
ncbi:helix-turn-helix domain-containing protein [Salinimonas lutimaris]|uniref:helix-turn-helix domain-containing protein n=1 Tax=Salinimonas lutimaris TaxID=914153 RepID=UPI0010C0B7B7|nr:helix-turn-helix domain-containing protein [Salinimonas lutimaris]